MEASARPNSVSSAPRRSDAARPTRRGRLAPFAPSELGLVGQVAASWGVGGGLVAALVVTLHMAFGSISSSVGFLTTTVAFLGGSLVGFLHGGILGYLGRPAEVSRRQALHRLWLALLYEVPTLVAGWAVAMLLALSAAALVTGAFLTLAFSALGWVAAAALLLWAGIETSRAVRHLCRRWPAARSLLVALGLAFLALLPVFLVTRPEIWIVGVRPSATAAAVMALVAALWIGGPAGVLGLLAVRAWRRRHPHAAAGPGGDGAAS